MRTDVPGSNSNRYYFWIVVFLVSMNLISLGALWYLHLNREEPVSRRSQQPLPGPGRAGRVMGFIVEELGFSRSQADRFRLIADAHHERSRTIADKIYLLKKDVTLESLKDSPDLEKIERLTDEIGRKEAKAERERMRHFQEIANFCDPEQREKLRALFREVFKSGQHAGRAGEQRLPPRLREGERRPPRERSGNHQPLPRNRDPNRDLEQ